jgi:hypothetical protein
MSDPDSDSTFYDQHLQALRKANELNNLNEEHGGWENSDGAYGEFRFDVGARSIHLEFNARFMDATNYSHDF